MAGNDRAPLGARPGSACRAAGGGLTPAVKLTTGESSGIEHNPPTGSASNPRQDSSDRRRSRAYIERFRQRIPLGRAIRLMCGACMGGEVDQMPRGEVAQAIDECGSCTCPLWPFRFGHDPWRPELSETKLAAVRRAGEKARRCLAAQRRTSAESATGDPGGTVEPFRPRDRLMVWKREGATGAGEGGAAETRPRRCIKILPLAKSWSLPLAGEE